MKLTKWFDGRKFVPAHVGVYKSKSRESGAIAFQFWDGEFWWFRSLSIQTAKISRAHKSAYQHCDWQGLAENPNDDQKV